MGTEDSFPSSFLMSQTNEANMGEERRQLNQNRDNEIEHKDLENNLENEVAIKSYHCRRCRTYLFDSTHLVTHVTSTQKFSYRKLNYNKNASLNVNSICGSYFLNEMIVSEKDHHSGGIDLLSEQTTTTNLNNNDVHTTNSCFSTQEPDSEGKDGHLMSFSGKPTDFITSQISLSEGLLEGKLICINHNCRARIGSFNWSGSQCSCGSWVSPAIQITKSKVDERLI